MFADWELIGVPHRVTISDVVSRKARSNTSTAATARATKVPASDVFDFLRARLALAVVSAG
jgi:prolyl-tRNA synthetase